MVKSDVQSTLTDPQSVIERDAVIFGELLAWGARKAIGPCVCFWCGGVTHIYEIIGIYIHRRDSFISDEIVAYADELTRDIDA